LPVNIFESCHKFFYRHTLTCAEVDNCVRGVFFTTLLDDTVKTLHCPDVSLGKIPDVDVVADARTITRGPVDAGQVKNGFAPERNFHQLANQMAGVADVQPCAHFGVSPDGVKVAQSDCVQAVGAAEVF